MTKEEAIIQTSKLCAIMAEAMKLMRFSPEDKLRAGGILLAGLLLENSEPKSDDANIDHLMHAIRTSVADGRSYENGKLQ